MDPGNLAAEPIPILLDVLEASGKTWRGWIVARDRGYATCWDLILGPEEEDRDPLCEIVQGWNPVRVSLPKDVRILGQLSPHRWPHYERSRSTTKMASFPGHARAPPRRRLGAGIERWNRRRHRHLDRQRRRPASRVSAPLPGDRRQSCLHPFSRRPTATASCPPLSLAASARNTGLAVGRRRRDPASRATGRDDGLENTRNKPPSPSPHPNHQANVSVTRARAKPSNCGSPTPRPRRRKSSKRCARSAPCPKPAVPGRT